MIMWTYSKKVGALLFGKHTLGPDPLGIINYFDTPQGERFSWPGNDGLIFTILRRMKKMEEEIENLKNAKK